SGAQVADCCVTVICTFPLDLGGVLLTDRMSAKWADPVCRRCATAGTGRPMLAVPYSDGRTPAGHYVMGNGGCHHHGVRCTSIRSTHLTHQYPRRPGATRRNGKPCPTESGAPATSVASSSCGRSLTGSLTQYPVAEVTRRLRAGPISRSSAVTGVPVQSCS